MAIKMNRIGFPFRNQTKNLRFFRHAGGDFREKAAVPRRPAADFGKPVSEASITGLPILPSVGLGFRGPAVGILGLVGRGLTSPILARRQAVFTIGILIGTGSGKLGFKLPQGFIKSLADHSLALKNDPGSTNPGIGISNPVAALIEIQPDVGIDQTILDRKGQLIFDIPAVRGTQATLFKGPFHFADQSRFIPVQVQRHGHSRNMGPARSGTGVKARAGTGSQHHQGERQGKTEQDCFHNRIKGGMNRRSAFFRMAKLVGRFSAHGRAAMDSFTILSMHGNEALYKQDLEPSHPRDRWQGTAAPQAQPA